MSDPHPHLYDAVLHKQVAKYTFNEFGATWGSYRFHREGENFVLDRYGMRVGMIYPDRVELRTPEGWPSESTYRHIFRKVYKERREKNAAGLVRKYAEIGGNLRVDFQQGLIVYNDGRIEGINETQLVAEKDNAKYRTFNKKLKALKAVIHTQISSGVFKDITTADRWEHPSRIPSIHNEIMRLRNTYKNRYDSANLTAAVDDWVKTGDPLLPRSIACMAFMLHSSEAARHSQEDLKRRVTNALKYAQTNYLREHCVTIRESKNSLRDTSDQPSELQPTAGLREVQVSGEVEVC